MAYARLSYKIPEEQSDFQVALDAPSWKAVVWDFHNHIRNKVKHEELPPAEYKVYEELKQLLADTVNEYELRW